MAIYPQLLELHKWYTLDASWSHTQGIELRLDGQLLKPDTESKHAAQAVSEKHPLHLARYDDTEFMSLILQN